MQFVIAKRTLKIFVVIVSIFYVLEILKIQVFSTQYKSLAKNNYVKIIVEKPTRGMILDRNLKLLVSNTPRFKIKVRVSEKKEEQEILFKLLKETNIKKTKQKKNAYYCEKVFKREEWLEIQEKLYSFKCFSIETTFNREYHKSMLSHVLGYIAEVDEKELKLQESQEEKKYLLGDLVGKTGLEKQYEEVLRGIKGVRYVVVDVNNSYQGEYDNGKHDIPSRPGKNIIITIDSVLQEYAEELMKNKVGSIVAIEPETGEVLCLVSSPFYDPNMLAGEGLRENYSKLLLDKNKPLFNRAISATYAPGSIFKTAQAIIATEIKVIDKTTTFPCDKNYIKCHNHPANLKLKEAIAHSCNPYFGYVFKRMINRGKYSNKFKDTKIGLDEWKEKVQKFGFGRKLKIDLPEEVSGMIPDSKYYDKIYGELRWKQSTIRSLDIGQGEALITPLQMCNMAVVIANKGFYIVPHVLKKIDEEEIEKEKVFLKFNNVDYDFFIECMHEATLYGTAKRANIPRIEVCAKTGTSQNNLGSGKDHSVCIAFAPKREPKIVVSVYVENAGWGGRAATAIAGLIIEKYLLGEVIRRDMEEYARRESFDERIGTI